MRLSITTRLVAMFALTVLATFVLIGTALYEVLDREQTRHQDAEIAGRLGLAGYAIERTGDLTRWAHVRDRIDAATQVDNASRVWVLCDDPRFQYGTGIDQIERLTQAADGSGTLSLPQTGQTFRTRSRHIDAVGERPAVRLIVGVDETPFLRTLRTFLVAMALLTACAMVLVVLLGTWIARVGLAPLQRLSREARDLSPSHLSQRLDTASLPRELSDLAQGFNGALGRLEDAYKQLEAFNADVAHELRTPLANLIGGTQVALSRPRSAVELQEVLESNLEELDRLRAIINDMLFLARADQGEAATGLVLADVSKEVDKTIEFFEPVLDETGTTVSVTGDLKAQVPMNVALFRRALSNLIQNGLEHATPSSALTVTIAPEGEAVWIRVSNPGAPIGAAHLPRLFGRFYRVDESRRDNGQHHGFGLGLAIVKAVADMHGGQVSAVSGDGLTTIGFSIPVNAGRFRS